jgi:hypothetical protein
MSYFSLAVSAQENYNPYGYATSLKQAVKQPTNISTLSIYYNKGLIYDETLGQITADAPFENLVSLKNLKQLRLNGAPSGFNAGNFFCSIANLKNLEVLELRMSLRKLGVLTEKQVNCLKKINSLKRLNLPHQYPWEDLKKLHEALPNCEIVINLYPEGE